MSMTHDSGNSLAAAFDRHGDMLYRLALSTLQSREDAEDAVQDVFLKYHTLAPEFDGEEGERAWLIRVTVNQCRDLLRRRGVRQYLPIDEMEIPVDDPGLQAQDGGDVVSLLAVLPEKLRTVMTLHYLEGLPLQEVAGALGISVSAVKMRLNRGRIQLKAHLGKEEGNV